MVSDSKQTDDAINTTTNILHELDYHIVCGCIIPNSPCMQDDRCSKKYPKQYTYRWYSITETQLGTDSYSLYKWGSPKNG